MKNKIIIFLLSIVYIYCASYRNNNHTFGAAREEISEETPARYLVCYALPPSDKIRCVQEASFESERLEFKRFLNDRGLSCESVDEGPEFIEEKQGIKA